MLRHWLRKLTRQQATRPRGRQRLRYPGEGGLRPSVEPLETRLVPAVGLDPSFGSGGMVMTDFLGPLESPANAVALQADGKAVVVGSTGDAFNTSANFAVVRYNTDGSPDPTFGTGGQVTTAFTSSDGPGRLSAANGVAVLGGGKILVVGTANSDVAMSESPHGDFALARYNNDGSLDAAFGTGGRVTTDFGSPGTPTKDVIRAVAVQADGKIVVAGGSSSDTTSAGLNENFALARYNSDGSLDTSFGSGGKVTTDLGSVTDEGAAALALQSDGKIVVAGNTRTPSGGFGIALARYTPSGSLDVSFGSGGKVVIDRVSGAYDVTNAVAVQGNGAIVVAGYTYVSSNDFALFRFTPTGTLDPTFGSGGKVVSDLGSGTYDHATALTILGDGRLLVAGSSSTTVGQYLVSTFAVARYNTNGSLDATFGTGGVTTTAFTSMSAEAAALAVQSDGKILLAGAPDPSTSGPFSPLQRFVLARYSANGSPDTGYGTGGQVVTPFIGSYDNGLTGLAQQADGKLVAVGKVTGATGNFAVARYNLDGSLDPGFGTDGRVTTVFSGTYGTAFPTAVAVQKDGKILVAGNADFAVARYNPDGTLDNSFGTGGKVSIFPVWMHPFTPASAMAVQSDGKILVFTTIGGPGPF